MENSRFLLNSTLALLDDAMENHPEHAAEFSHLFNIIESKAIFDNEAKGILRYVLHFRNE